MNDPDENEDQEYRIDEIESMHLINSFEEVNLTDPFPSKVQEAPKTAAKSAWGKLGNKKKTSKEVVTSRIEELVYDESKFNQFHPPTLVFIPCKTVLRKLMRLCA